MEGLQLSQMSLVLAILREIEHQVPNAKATQRVMDTVTRCATEIVQSAAIPFREAKTGAGLMAWYASDDTGLSSKFMAHIVYGGPAAKQNHPHDSEDWGRCLRLIEACGKPDPEKLADLRRYDGWSKWIETLPK